MSNRLKKSVFYQVYFPKVENKPVTKTASFRKFYRNHLKPSAKVLNTSWVVFDLETTGFNKDHDRIIEIGATKYHCGKEIDNFSTLVNVDRSIPEVVKKLTGISESMLIGKPKIFSVIPKFMDFIKGSLLVCHNSSFDMNMLGAELTRHNITMDYDCLCTLKMARDLLHDIADRKLVTIASYYNLSYETQHRSLSDARITAKVLNNLLNDHPSLSTWHDLKEYAHAVIKKY